MLNRNSAVLVGILALAHACFAEEVDFISLIKRSPDLGKAVGLQKLTESEQAALNGLLNRTYQMGTEGSLESAGSPPTKPAPRLRPRSAGMPVYATKIDEDSGDVLKLSNGAIVEISMGYLGYVGFRKDAVLYKDGLSWKIWIEGKKSFRCEVIKEPDVSPCGSGELVSISEVKGNGKILSTAGGSLYEVDDMGTIHTSMWLSAFEALLIDGSRLMNLDEGGEMVDVTKLN